VKVDDGATCGKNGRRGARYATIALPSSTVNFPYDSSILNDMPSCDVQQSISSLMRLLLLVVCPDLF
jgi:hypothetical protein